MKTKNNIIVLALTGLASLFVLGFSSNYAGDWIARANAYIRGNLVVTGQLDVTNSFTLHTSYGTFSNVAPDRVAIFGLQEQLTNSLMTSAQLEFLRTNWTAYPTNVLATFQPLDSDLTAIAALATTALGRSILTLVDILQIQTNRSDYSFVTNVLDAGGVRVGTGGLDVQGNAVSGVGSLGVNELLVSGGQLYSDSPVTLDSTLVLSLSSNVFTTTDATNYVVDFAAPEKTYRRIWLTNEAFFTHATNFANPANAYSAQLILYAEGGSRAVYFPTNWNPFSTNDFALSGTAWKAIIPSGSKMIVSIGGEGDSAENQTNVNWVAKLKIQ